MPEANPHSLWYEAEYMDMYYETDYPQGFDDDPWVLRLVGPVLGLCKEAGEGRVSCHSVSTTHPTTHQSVLRPKGLRRF